MVKKWYTSKAVWLGVIMCSAAIGEFLAGLPPTAAITQIVSGILTIVARFVTSEPITQKAAVKLQTKMAAKAGK